MKNEYVYPGSDLDRSKTLISLLGSFWSRTYTAIDQIHSYVDATAHEVAQTHLNLLELVATMSRFETPLFHEETLTPIVLRRSEMNTALTNTVLFDVDKGHFNGELIFDAAVAGELYSFPLPEKLRGVSNIFNKITFPTLILNENVDYTIDARRNALVFTRNPFDENVVSKRAIQINGLADEEIVLWGFSGKFDYEYVFNQFAYALGIRLQSSQNYKDLINALFNSLVAGGMAAKNLDLALSAITGIPAVAEPYETVEVVEYDSTGLLIVTDKTAYKFQEDATPIVVVGQKVRAGDQLIQGFEISEFFFGNSNLPADEALLNRPDVIALLSTNAYENVATENSDDILVSLGKLCPPRPALAALALDNGFLSTCFYGDLVFENKTVPLEIDAEHPSGYTFVKFALGGFPADVERFFDELHARGIEAAETAKNDCFYTPIEYDSLEAFPAIGLLGRAYRAVDTGWLYRWVVSLDNPPGRYEQIVRVPPNRKLGTLAQLLDKRRQPSGEPTNRHLPATINPLRFLIENILRNNVFVVRITVPALGQNRLGLYNIRHLRRVLPPQTAMLVVFELGVKVDKIDAEKNVWDVVGNFTGLEPRADVVDENYVKDLGATLSKISGTCQ
jgi:hypothetical protein